MKLVRSELINVGAHNFNSKSKSWLFRTRYYTKVHFMYHGETIALEMIVDTGATSTVIGTKNPALDKIREYIGDLEVCKNRDTRDASGTFLEPKLAIVEDFKLAEGIVFPKVKVLFSDIMEHRAVLGMDILTMFDFNYVKKDKTIYLHYPENFIDNIMKMDVIKEKGYIDLDYIALIDSWDLENITHEDIEAYRGNKMIEERQKGHSSK